MRKTAAVAAAALLLAGYNTLSERQLAEVIAQSSIRAPWQTEQVAVNDGRIAWIVNVLSKPRQVSPELCLVDGEAMIVGPRMVVRHLQPIHGIALRSCEGVLLADLRFLHGAISEQQLQRAAGAVLAIMRTGTAPGVTASFTSDKERAAVRQIRPDQLWEVEIAATGEIRFSFAAAPLSPQMISFAFQSDVTAVRIFIEDAPDLKPAQ